MMRSSVLLTEPLAVATDTGPLLAPGGTIMINISDVTTCTSGTGVAPMRTAIGNTYPEPNTNTNTNSPADARVGQVPVMFTPLSGVPKLVALFALPLDVVTVTGPPIMAGVTVTRTISVSGVTGCRGRYSWSLWMSGR